MGKHKQSALTQSHELYVDAKMRGRSDTAAAVEAGFSHPPRTEAVRNALENARKEVRDAAKLTRLDIIEGIMDGIDIARMMADSGNVIKGWVEAAKILGLAAPEVKRIDLTISQSRVRAKFETLSDAELLQIQEGMTVEGEAVPVG